MHKKFFGLGKGLGSLIPEGKAAMQPTASKENVFYVEVSKIEANPDQPRQDFDGDALKELSVSIRKYGVLQPLLVSKVETSSARGMDVTYRLIAGERRLRASRMAGLPHVPVIIRDDFVHDRDRLEVALIENIQREDLNPLEQAEAYQRLAKDFGLTHQEIATKVGKARESISNTIRLMALPQEIKVALRGGKIPFSAGRALLAFTDPVKQKASFQSILAGGVSTRDVEVAASVGYPSRNKKRRLPQTDNKFIELARNLAERLDTPVEIAGAVTSGGKMIIKFANLENLNSIVKRIID